MSNEQARKKYLAKIQKLMRLANNTSSPEEAANAMSKAQAFMREHGLSETDVTLSEINTSDSKTAPSDAKKMPRYMNYLASTIEKAFGVSCIFTWRHTTSWQLKRVVSFYGHDGRDVAAAYVFDVLTRQLKAARKNFIDEHCRRYKRANRTAMADQFSEGWAGGAYHAVKEMVLSEEQQNQMQAYKEHLQSGGMKAATTRKAKDSDAGKSAAYMGYVEGSKTKVYHGVNGESNGPAQIGFVSGGDRG